MPCALGAGFDTAKLWSQSDTRLSRLPGTRFGSACDPGKRVVDVKQQWRKYFVMLHCGIPNTLDLKWQSHLFLSPPG